MRNMFPWIQFSCNNRTFMIWRSYQAITIVHWQTATIACHFVYCNIPSSFAVVAHSVSYKLEIVLSNHIVSTFNLYISSFRIRISRTKVFIQSNVTNQDKFAQLFREQNCYTCIFAYHESLMFYIANIECVSGGSQNIHQILSYGRKKLYYMFLFNRQVTMWNICFLYNRENKNFIIVNVNNL